jgi:hypothetical protein
MKSICRHLTLTLRCLGINNVKTCENTVSDTNAFDILIASNITPDSGLSDNQLNAWLKAIKCDGVLLYRQNLGKFPCLPFINLCSFVQISKSIACHYLHTHLRSTVLTLMAQR